MRIISFTFLTLFASVLILYLPILANPKILLERGNDLEEFFWPIHYYVKQNLFEHKSLPLWNNLFLSGTPLLPDPQSPLFYPPNVLFVFLPLDAAFITSLLLHTTLGAFGFFLLARKLGLPAPLALFASLIYAFSPRFAGYLEAGHLGLALSWGILPWIPLSILNLGSSARRWTIILALGLAGIFYNHIVTFMLVALLASGLFLYLFATGNRRLLLSAKFLFVLTLVFGFIAISLLPQLEWAPYTTRNLLLNQRDTYPKWSSLAEYFSSIFLAFPQQKIWTLDTEKFIFLGVATPLLAIIGFLRLGIKYKVTLVIAGVVVFLITTNNLSPVYKLLLGFDPFVLTRVSTRLWFIVPIAIALLAALGLEKMWSTKTKLAGIIMVISLIELLFISWTRITKPVEKDRRVAPDQIYSFLKKDQDLYRVFCVNRCIPQKQAAINNLELVEGYSTLQQLNYYRHMWQFTGRYWDYYTLSLPPIGTYTFEKIEPDPKALGKYNVKYIISPYSVENPHLVPKINSENYYLYQNLLTQPRVYPLEGSQDQIDIISRTPNRTEIKIKGDAPKNLVFSQAFSPGWSTYLDNGKEVKVQETPDGLSLVDLDPGTKSVRFVYSPDSFILGKAITGITIFVAVIFLWKL